MSKSDVAIIITLFFSVQLLLVAFIISAVTWSETVDCSDTPFTPSIWLLIQAIGTTIGLILTVHRGPLDAIDIVIFTGPCLAIYNGLLSMAGVYVLVQSTDCRETTGGSIVWWFILCIVVISLVVFLVVSFGLGIIGVSSCIRRIRERPSKSTETA